MPEPSPVSDRPPAARRVHNGACHSAEELTDIVGANVRRFRRRQGLSLDRLAKLSGVSRAMLSQIETGKSVPTIALLWKVSNALGVAVPHLLTSDKVSAVQILRKRDAKILAAQDARHVKRALHPEDGERRVEFHEVRLAALHREHLAPHAPGARDNLLVAQGQVEISLGSDKPFVLAQGDAALFEADVPHVFRNLSAEEAVLYVVAIHADAAP
jgi:transcriptional regulator with XRE-family HTH domain